MCAVPSGVSLAGKVVTFKGTQAQAKEAELGPSVRGLGGNYRVIKV